MILESWMYLVLALMHAVCLTLAIHWGHWNATFYIIVCIVGVISCLWMAYDSRKYNKKVS